MKSWATPLAAGTFLILAVTGILMFFKIEAGLIKPFHEWLSWAMVAGVIFHIVANWKSFTSYFARKPALSIMGACGLILLLSVFMPAQRNGNPRMKMTKALESAKLEAVAAVAGKESGAVILKLQNKGISEADGSMTIREIAERNQKKEMEVLGIIFE